MMKNKKVKYWHQGIHCDMSEHEGQRENPKNFYREEHKESQWL